MAVNRRESQRKSPFIARLGLIWCISGSCLVYLGKWGAENLILRRVRRRLLGWDWCSWALLALLVGKGGPGPGWFWSSLVGGSAAVIGLIGDRSR